MYKGNDVFIYNFGRVLHIGNHCNMVPVDDSLQIKGTLYSSGFIQNISLSVISGVKISF